MITEKNHKLLTSQLFVTDYSKKGLASMLALTQDHMGKIQKYILL
jgi:hypothetical protein